MTTREQSSESVPAVPLPRVPVRKRARAPKRAGASKRAAGRKRAHARKSAPPHRRAGKRTRAQKRNRAQYPVLLQWSDATPRPAHRVGRYLAVCIRRTTGMVMGLAIIGLIIVIGLLMITPPVSNAPALTTALDHAHQAVYPGPPVPARFASSLISTEDHRFYSEPGIDPFAVARVILGHFTSQPDQGGATLYQQLAKMLYTRGRPGMLTQTEQVVLGIKLDLRYAKPQILQMYSDVAYFGHGFYGLSAASCGYFGVAPAALTWPQAALLAGLVQAPSADDPLTHLAIARAREAHVLGRLVATGRLSLVQAQWAYRYPLHLNRGPATSCLPATSKAP